MLAIMIEQMLEEFGCHIVGPVSSVARAMAVIHEQELDGVLLDLNAHGHTTFPVAEALSSLAVPFLLVTGYASHENDPALLQTAPRLRKPFAKQELACRMAEMFAPEAPPAFRTTL